MFNEQLGRMDINITHDLSIKVKSGRSLSSFDLPETYSFTGVPVSGQLQIGGRLQ